MANLSQIKTDSNWGDTAATINQNFNQVKTELITLKNTTSVYLPLFTNTVEASEKILNPRPGQLVLISPESSIPAPLYKWNGSRWADTGQTGGSAEVPLSNYYTKEEINQQKEDTDSKFSELKSDTISRYFPGITFGVSGNKIEYPTKSTIARPIPSGAKEVLVNIYSTNPNYVESIVSFWRDRDLTDFISNGFLFNAQTESNYICRIPIPDEAKYLAISDTKNGATSNLIEYVFKVPTIKKYIYIDGIANKLPNTLSANTVYILQTNVTKTDYITLMPGSELWCGDYQITFTSTYKAFKIDESEINNPPIIKYNRIKGHYPFIYKAIYLFSHTDSSNNKFENRVVINDGNEIYLDDFFPTDDCFMGSLNTFVAPIKNNRYLIEGIINFGNAEFMNKNVNWDLQFEGTSLNSTLVLDKVRDTAYSGATFCINGNCSFRNLTIKTLSPVSSVCPKLKLYNTNDSYKDLLLSFENCILERIQIQNIDTADLVNLNDDVIKAINNRIVITDSTVINGIVNIYYASNCTVERNTFTSTVPYYDSNAQVHWQRGVVVSAINNSIIRNNNFKYITTGVLFVYFSDTTEDKIRFLKNYGSSYNNKINDNIFIGISSESIMCDASKYTKQEDNSDYGVLNYDKNTLVSSSYEVTNTYPTEAGKVVQTNDTVIGNLLFEEKFELDIYKKCVIVSMTKGDKFGDFSPIRDVQSIDGKVKISAVVGDFFKDDTEGTVYAIMFGFYNNDIKNNRFLSCYFDSICLYNITFGNVIEGNFCNGNLVEDKAFMFICCGPNKGRVPFSMVSNNVIKDNVSLTNQAQITFFVLDDEGKRFEPFNALADKFPTEKNEFFPFNMLRNNIVPIIRNVGTNIKCVGNIKKDGTDSQIYNQD